MTTTTTTTTTTIFWHVSSPTCSHGKDKPFGRVPPHSDVDLEGSFGIAGMLHIISNAMNDVDNSMVHFGVIVDTMSAIAGLIRHPGSRKRLFNRCYSCKEGMYMRAKFDNFNGQCYRKRWGTVANCILKLLKLKRTLRWGWNLSRYIEGGSSKSRDDDGKLKTLQIIDDAINGISSKFFWSYLEMLKVMAEAVMWMITWCESCPCHYHLLHGKARDTATRAEISLWEKCGRRGVIRITTPYTWNRASCSLHVRTWRGVRSCVACVLGSWCGRAWTWCGFRRGSGAIT